MKWQEGEWSGAKSGADVEDVLEQQPEEQLLDLDQGEDRPPVPLIGNPPSPPPQMMSKALIHGLAEATSNIIFGSTISGQGTTPAPRGAARSTGPPLHTLWWPTHKTSRAKQVKQSHPSPYPSRDRRAPPPQAPLVIAPQSSGGAQASGVPPQNCIHRALLSLDSYYCTAVGLP